MGKAEVLDGVLEQIRKRYGDGSIMWLGDSTRHNIEVIPTGSLALDIALGIGGVPRGRIVEIFGPESSGKTTLALHLIAQAQKRGGVTAFIDAEHALDPKYASAIGVDLRQVLLSQPNSGEQALEITEQLVRSSAVDIIVVDSVAALVPEAEITGSMGDAQVGLQARLMSQAMRKLTSAVGNSKTTVVFINQIRAMINAGSPWGPSTTTTGGLALKFYASLRIEIKRIGSVDEGTGENKQKIGNETLIKVVKNKLAPPFREARVDIIYGKGFVRTRELITLGEDLNLVKKSGAWYSYNDEKLGQGLTNSALALEQNEALAKQIEQEILTKVGLQRTPITTVEITSAQPSENGHGAEEDERPKKITKRVAVTAAV
ncbi:recombinase RecA [Candidatus Acetothermia bacterium]|nr:recombinase RecA [Candidatus Acetothermia bacterium]MBI3642792.1 recombinase RecA [Candidatus Acetothermia bacterium]